MDTQSGWGCVWLWLPMIYMPCTGEKAFAQWHNGIWRWCCSAGRPLESVQNNCLVHDPGTTAHALLSTWHGIITHGASWRHASNLIETQCPLWLLTLSVHLCMFTFSTLNNEFWLLCLNGVLFVKGLEIIFLNNHRQEHWSSSALEKKLKDARHGQGNLPIQQSMQNKMTSTPSEVK